MAIEFNLNGQAQSVDVPAEMPLLWVLRDVLGFKGTKYGCGQSYCGACTVHINGTARRSCQITVGRVAGREITTIEGLSADGTHPVQLAWKELDVPQCGYCQAGQIMSASALLADAPEPSDEQIDRAMGANLCRCATYGRIRAAVHRAVELGAEGGASATESSAAAGGDER